MGTYLKFRAPDDKRHRADAWLKKQSKALGLWDEADQKIEREKGERGSPDFMPLGTGQIKLSALEDDECNRYVDILIEARKKWKVECFDIPSNVGDYIDAERLAKLIDLPAHEKIWAAEAAEEAVWTRARKKAMKAAGKEYEGGGHPMTVATWGHARANLLFMAIEAADHPTWVSVSYDRKGKWDITAKRERDEDKKFDLLRDAKGRGFLSLPLMTLGAPGIKNGFDDVRDYLARARNIGLRTHPDSIMIGVYGCLPAEIVFGSKLLQLAAPHGPYVSGVYMVKSGHRYYPHTAGVVLNGDGALEWGKLGGQRAAELIREHKLKDEHTPVPRFFVSYPALGTLLAET
jgi:hypothetical protein